MKILSSFFFICYFKMDKTWSKKDLLELITIYTLPIEDGKDFNKSTLSQKIFECLQEFEIEWSEEFPEINTQQDLIELLENPKDNLELDYKATQEMIQRAKRIIHYCRNGYIISGSNYLSIEDIYSEGLIVSDHCDIPTCRRAVKELNSDKKIREPIEIKISNKVKKELEQKNINKDLLSNRLQFRKGYYRVDFD